MLVLLALWMLKLISIASLAVRVWEGRRGLKAADNKRERTVPGTAERHHDGRHRDALW